MNCTRQRCWNSRNAETCEGPPTAGWRRLVCLLGMWIGCAGTGFAQDGGGVVDREYAIKATFLYHFSNYVEWPADAFPSTDDPFVIGIVGKNPFGGSLRYIAQKKKVDNRSIEIRDISSVDDALRCQILFVPGSLPMEVQERFARATTNHPVLVVGESDGFVEHGGNVQFYLEGNKVRFAFGADIAKRDDLKVSSKLMTLAKIVSPK